MKRGQSLAANFLKLLAMLLTVAAVIYIYSYTRLTLLLVIAPLIIFINFRKINAFKESLQDSIYIKTVVKFGTQFYTNVIPTFTKEAKILDVGIGNAISLISCADTIRGNDLYVSGIDINPATIEIANFNIKKENLDGNITAECVDIYQYKDSEYDGVLFSMSWPCIPDPKKMVKYAMKFVRPGGKLCIGTTLDEKATCIKRFIKPRLMYVLGKMNDFGRVTTFDEMEQFLKENFDKYEMKPITQIHWTGYGNATFYVIEIYNTQQ